MPFTGHQAFDPQGESDLAVDETLDALETDAKGDLLIVKPQTQWTGQTASETL
ncbi:MAG: hypothetical protein KGL69_01550 [Alphaproteobacteria bacterium]|nr:hypothetical protein [Alphaproteobacteria bacterium]